MIRTVTKEYETINNIHNEFMNNHEIRQQELQETINRVSSFINETHKQVVETAEAANLLNQTSSSIDDELRVLNTQNQINTLLDDILLNW